MKDYVTGRLKPDGNGYWAIAGWYTLQDGCLFEINLNGTWVKTQMVGHCNYFTAIGLKGLELNGRVARVKA